MIFKRKKVEAITEIFGAKFNVNFSVKGKQLDRMVSIIIRAAWNRYFKVSELADEFDVSIRTLYEDMKRLRKWDVIRFEGAPKPGRYPDPDWLESGSTFRVIFYSHPDTDYSDADVPINVPVNERQQWFLNQLKAGENIKNTDLASHWNVSEKTAKRDIAYLTKQGIIEFMSPPKTGAYYLKEQRDVT